LSVAESVHTASLFHAWFIFHSSFGMALAVASATSLFGNNFQYDASYSRKPSISVEIIQQYSTLSHDVLELYGLYNYIHKKVSNGLLYYVHLFYCIHTLLTRFHFLFFIVRSLRFLSCHRFTHSIIPRSYPWGWLWVNAYNSILPLFVPFHSSI
jgi:hypothetical protein